ncbi:OmpH family outer membrane protein [Pontimicrobium sp. IMCC45349]|jgi:Skp family chaperone for outer membrane proteins|uniref:OmpH family outer membrane protein n=1 Tax=Pontimicrobium sp. IMCC45349 TaxID=3391574 RepID=UPI0039A1D25C
MKSINFNTKRLNAKALCLLALTFFLGLNSFAQRSIRIGYIDTEYILQNVPEYQSATSQLDSKVQKWKTEIETRLSAIEEKKKQLNNERVLLTKELIEEREEEILIEETEVIEYQQKRFGPEGDLVTQKRQLMQPIQDQIFSAVQDIAANKRYDFIFDKSADVVMLYSADRYDISDLVLRTITRSSKRRQVQNRKEKQAAEDEDVVPVINKEAEAREKALEDKKAAREKLVADKRQQQLDARAAKKKELEDKKKKILEDRAKAREEKLKARNGGNTEKKAEETETEKKTTEKAKDSVKTEKATAKKTNDSTAAKKATDKKAKAKPLSDREARKKALEEKKKKILAERKAKLEARKKAKENDTTSTKKKN